MALTDPHAPPALPPGHRIRPPEQPGPTTQERAAAPSAPSRLTAPPEQPSPAGSSAPSSSASCSSASSQSATLIGSVQRAMRLLECVAQHQHGAPAKQLAREAGLAL